MICQRNSQRIKVAAGVLYTPTLAKQYVDKVLKLWKRKSKPMESHWRRDII